MSAPDVTGGPGVTFHFNVPNRPVYACRLLRKACRGGARLVVTADPARLTELDRLLWTFEALDFVPHWRAESVSMLPQRLRQTPVLLLDRPEPDLGHDVLVNLGDEVPAAHGKFRRVIEIVARDESSRASARERWRHYASLGLRIERHEVTT